MSVLRIHATHCGERVPHVLLPVLSEAEVMNVSTIHYNAFGSVSQVQPHAGGARIADGKGNSIDVRYDEDAGRWVIDPTFASEIVVNEIEHTYLLRKL
jgi:hypothetical protein